MRIVVLTASNRQPPWIHQGYQAYAQRLRGLELKEIPLAKRCGSSPGDKAREQEGRRMLRAIPARAHVVALTLDGQLWSTEALSKRLAAWMGLGQPVYLLVGGPDGLSEACLGRAQERWSLSPLTLPHGLVRVAVAEALYRAWSIIQGHPYHRS